MPLGLIRHQMTYRGERPWPSAPGAREDLQPQGAPAEPPAAAHGERPFQCHSARASSASRTCSSTSASTRASGPTRAASAAKLPLQGVAQGPPGAAQRGGGGPRRRLGPGARGPSRRPGETRACGCGGDRSRVGRGGMAGRAWGRGRREAPPRSPPPRSRLGSLGAFPPRAATCWKLGTGIALQIGVPRQGGGWRSPQLFSRVDRGGFLPQGRS